ncbi:type IVB secretion system protein IcmH/DotU [Azospirillum rugosum]|uniref:Type VI secretion system protein ImpK n=1 Tax=Azospirillum rugosum TaxID=416170 RepID=A0ABS4SKY0_9PROT|nr:type IVB secretion system protein IcmH/DotU [Azospirillum rugosum]MBP2293222.1 type VI secretion system protein ImpK [Azospirillum rugosum]
MNEDDPFGIEDADKTIFNPVGLNAGGGSARRAGAPAPPPPPPSSDPTLAPLAGPQPDAAPPASPGGSPGGFRGRLHAAAEQGRAPVASPTGEAIALPHTGVNPLAAAAAPLLGLVSRLRTASMSVPIEQVRAQTVAALRDFEGRATAQGAPRETVRTAHYALCATIDDIVLNTPWGNRSPWAAASMVSSFHNEVTGGERFYRLLEPLMRQPAANRDLLELLYLCLALGFEGQYRLSPRGQSELARTRDAVYRSIAELRGTGERDLSIHWRGVAMPHRTTSTGVPLWVIGVGAAALLLAAHVGFSFALNDRTDRTLAELVRLPPRSPPQLSRPTLTPQASVPAPPAERPADPAPRPSPRIAAPSPPPPFAQVRGFLEPEVRQGLVSLHDTPDGLVIRMRAGTMFRSGSASVEKQTYPLLDRIGQALEGEPGLVQVVGHTDNVPIRTVRFPSNWHLSKARAEAVRDHLARLMSDPARLSADGKADLEPVASNNEAEGREENRRTDILVRAGSAPAMANR